MIGLLQCKIRTLGSNILRSERIEENQNKNNFVQLYLEVICRKALE